MEDTLGGDPLNGRPRVFPGCAVRAGYGIAFNPLASFQITAAAGRVPGGAAACAATPGGATTAGCAALPDRRIGEGFPLEIAPPVTRPSSFLTLPAQPYAGGCGLRSRAPDPHALPAPGENGIGRNVFVGPGFWNLDLGLHKRFDLGERAKIELRMEMFNALNHPNFDSPRDATAGAGALSIRSGNFGQTCCATVAPASAQNVLQNGESARVIQFALKALW